ncbi:unnamed protein product [Dovyalis caffra]|uniref:Pectinesterase inhibitor domain-containing protein n=1 Tax=Dovyalis caffra TaxID=77055 RepID=A0AAV1SKC3_9ROSI|nr:unnamed protein product [Dovyalis caffra]
MAKDVSHRIDDPREQAALVDCVELMELSVGRIKDSIVALESVIFNPHENAHARLRSVLANYHACLDGLNGSARSTMEPGLNDLIMRLNSENRKVMENLPKDIKTEGVVAEDRRGKYKTFVVQHPNDGETGYVIYVQNEA